MPSEVCMHACVVQSDKNDIQEAAGTLQVCAGHLSGCETAVHAIHRFFQSPNTEGVIFRLQ